MIFQASVGNLFPVFAQELPRHCGKHEFLIEHILSNLPRVEFVLVMHCNTLTP